MANINKGFLESGYTNDFIMKMQGIVNMIHGGKSYKDVTDALSITKDQIPEFDDQLNSFVNVLNDNSLSDIADDNSLFRDGIVNPVNVLSDYFKDPSEGNFDKAVDSLDGLEKFKTRMIENARVAFGDQSRTFEDNLENVFGEVNEGAVSPSNVDTSVNEKNGFMSDESADRGSMSPEESEFMHMDWTDMVNHIAEGLSTGVSSEKLRDDLAEYNGYHPDFKDNLGVYRDTVESMPLPDDVRSGYLSVIDYMNGDKPLLSDDNCMYEDAVNGINLVSRYNDYVDDVGADSISNRSWKDYNRLFEDDLKDMDFSPDFADSVTKSSGDRDMPVSPTIEIGPGGSSVSLSKDENDVHADRLRKVEAIFGDIFDEYNNARKDNGFDFE